MKNITLREAAGTLGRGRRVDNGQFIKTGEREYGCYDVLGRSGLQKGHYFRSLSALVDDSTTCFGRYRGFQIYEAPREIRKKG